MVPLRRLHARPWPSVMAFLLRVWLTGVMTCGAALAPAQSVQDAGRWVEWTVNAEAKPEGLAPAATLSRSLQLRGWWSDAGSLSGEALPHGQVRTHPVVIMLHGCGGMLNPQGEPNVRMKDYARLLNAQGWHTLAVDSLTPRGETELCTQRNASRKVKVTDRTDDVLSALSWLTTQPQVDVSRVALLGWSNGGSTLLAAINGKLPSVAAHVASGQRQAILPTVAVAFYPGCEVERRRGFQPVAPVWLLLGADDDWTPPQACQALASEQVQVRTWPGAVHGFDGTAAVRLRLDVPNGARPGSGVHVGAHPQAREESRGLLLRVLQEAFAHKQ